MILIKDGQTSEIKDFEAWLKERYENDISSHEELEEFNKICRLIRMFNGNITIEED